MAIIPVTEDGNSDKELRITVAAPGFSDWYILPQGTILTNVEVVPGAGATCTVEATMDRLINPDGSVDGVAWPPQSVTTRTQYTLNGSASLIRLVVSVGAAVMIVKAVKS
jgi:hypothetical protein